MMTLRRAAPRAVEVLAAVPRTMLAFHAPATLLPARRDVATESRRLMMAPPRNYFTMSHHEMLAAQPEG